MKHIGNIDLKDTLGFNEPFQRKNVNCEIHGANSESLINGRCAACFKQKIEIENFKIQQENTTKAKEMALIPPRFIKCTFENYFPETARADRLLNFCKQFEFEKNLVFVGKTGTGKTHLACALLEKAIKKNLTALYVKFYDISDIKIKQAKLFDRIIKSNILVIDEYGQQESDFKSNLLFEIIDKRYDYFNKTILLSNIEAEAFRSTLTMPLYSRLREEAIIKSCDWDDYRLKGIK